MSDRISMLPTFEGNEARRIKKRHQPGRADTVLCEVFINHSERGIINGFLTYPGYTYRPLLGRQGNHTFLDNSTFPLTSLAAGTAMCRLKDTHSVTGNVTPHCTKYLSLWLISVQCDHHYAAAGVLAQGSASLSAVTTTKLKLLLGLVLNRVELCNLDAMESC